MDKDKNRIDLIAAGRKKLQQFRQKKDAKGTSSSHGKSSQKSGKSGSLAVRDASAPILGGTDVVYADSGVISTVPDSAVEDVGQVVGPDVGSADSLLATEDAYVPISGGINVTSGDSVVVSTVLDSAFEDARQVVGPDVGSFNLSLAAEDASVPISSGTDVASDDSGVPDSLVEDIGQVVGPDVGLTDPLVSSTVATLEEEEVVQRTGDNEEGQLEAEVMESGVQVGAVFACKDEESRLVAEDKAAFSGVENQIEGTVVEDVIQHVGANLSAPQEENYASLATALPTDDETGTCRSLHQEVDLFGSGNLDGTDEADRGAERNNKVMGQKGEAVLLSSNAGDREEEKRFSIPVETNGSTLNPIQDQPEVSNVCSDNRVLPFSTEQVEGLGENVEQDAEVVPEAFGKSVPSNDAVVVASFVAENCDSMEKCDDISRVDALLSGEEEGSREQAVSPENFVSGRDIYETECNHGLDVLKRQLYVANVAKECLQMQLAEHADLQVVFEQHSEVLYGDVSKLRSLVKETQEINENISGELAYCKSELNTLYLEKEEFRLQFLSGKEEIKELSAQCCQLLNKLKESENKVAYLLTANNELQMSHNSAESETQKIKASASDLNLKLEKFELEASDLSNELAECRGLLSDLQIENANLTERCNLALSEKEKLEKEKDDFAGVNAKISTDLLEHKERVANVLKSQAHLEVKLKETLTWIDSLSEENIYLSTLLEVHNCNLKELDTRYCELFALQRSAICQLQNSDLLSEVAYKSGEEEFPPSSRVDDIDHTCDLTREYAKTGGILDPSYNQRLGSFDKLASFKGHLEKGRKILEKLEKAVQLMQSHSDITNRPMNKTGASGVSKLIQAFESKVQQDEIGTEESLLSEERFLISSKSARELISSLGNTFEQFSLDISETNKIIDDMSQSKSSMTAALRNLETEYESKFVQTDQLVARIGVLVHDMAKFQETLDALQIQIDGLQLNFSDVTDSLFNQTDLLENIVNETVSLLDQDREYLLSSIFCRIEKLNASIRLLVSPSSPGDLVANASSSTSVDAAVKMIESLCAAFEAAYTDSERIHLLYKELDERFIEADGKSREAIEMLDGMCKNLENLVHDFWRQDAEEIKEESKKEKSLDVTPSKFEILINQLRVLLDEKQHLDSLRKELESEMMKRKDELTEVKQRCSLLSEKLDENESKKCDVGSIEKVIKIIQAEVQIEKGLIREDLPPLVQLENLIAFLLLRYKEAAEQIAKSVSFLKEVTATSDVPSDYWLGPLHVLLKQECDSNLMKLNELQEEVCQLSAIVLQKEDEAFMLKETMAKVEESLEVSRSELLAKTSELEQSDQKLSSVREKLSLAVSKGKGLIVQRDGLKQSLMEKSSELDKMLQDMQLKDERLRETENKLKIYSEAGERIEALESELSYIRNSATALRESFLLKDSVLQRIEEVLEDLALSEPFHSKDVIEKIEWLARLASGTSLPLTDWNNHTSVEGSYPNSGYPGINSWREDSQVASEQVGLDAVQNKYEELERKYYGLAEHNEMLEQSLLERNSLVQRWEETLNKIDFPDELGSMEPEIQIEWLGKALIDAHHERDYWHLKVDELESSLGLLIAEVNESKKKLYDVNENFVTVSHEKDILSRKLDEHAQMHETVLKKMTQLELDKETMLNEVVLLQEKLSQSSNNYHLMVNEVTELSHMISDILPDHEKENIVYSNNVSDDLRLSLSALINRYTALSNEKPKDNIEDHDIQNPEEVVTDKEVEVATIEVEQEKYSFKTELDEALNKLALITEEKSVIQEKYQSLVVEFATIRTEKDELQELFSQEEQKSASAREKLNIAVRKGKGLVQQRDTLKQSIEEMSAEIDRLKHELDQKNNDLFTISSKVVAMESDNSFLRNNLRQTEYEAEKLKKASELLLAELNEVHERADNLQDELEKAKGDVHELSRQKDSLEAERIDMVSNLDLFRNHQSSHLLEIKTFVEHLRKGCFDLSDMLANSISKDGKILDNVEASMEAFWKQIAGTQNFPFSHLPSSAPILEKKDGLSVTGSLLDLKINDETGATDMYGAIADAMCQCSTLIDQLKKKCLKHSTTIEQWAIVLPETLKCIYNELTLHKESFESTKKNLTHLKLLKEEKDSGMSLLYKSLALLYETCTCSVWRLENQNVHDSDVRFKPLPSIDELGTTSGSPFTSLEELVRLTADSLLSAVNDRQSELSQKDLKDTIMDLQKEIQDKDLQTNRICEELVTQIKEAEATARNYLAELESVKTHTEAMEKELEVTRTEKSVLESKLNQNHQVAKKKLEEKIESLTDVIASKDQEIDALMQALDEEESQMETLTGKIDGLEKTIQEKNLALECLDATRGKAMSKLSTTINRFNELHGLSEGLISEVETLQTQLEGKETEVSFLRQEVMKCTNEILTLQGSNKKYSSEVLKILTWLKLMASELGIQNMQVDEKDGSLIHDYGEILGKAITSVLSELNELRLAAQSRDLMLQAGRHKVEELAHTEEVLKTSIREKEAQLQMLQATHNSGQSSNVSSMETLEVDQVRSKRSVALGSISPHVPSLRKVNNDQVAVGIDLESDETVLEDEDDDKAHGFKPLVMSSFVPRATRPIADKVDGLWVSGERMLMRQPTLRIGVVVYWILLHTFLATTIV